MEDEFDMDLGGDDDEARWNSYSLWMAVDAELVSYIIPGKRQAPMWIL